LTRDPAEDATAPAGNRIGRFVGYGAARTLTDGLLAGRGLALH